jgi:hypothetical protein
MEYIIVGLYLGLGLGLPDKAARLRDQIMGEHDFEPIRETMLWKAYEAVSVIVAVTIMPALMFAHWLLGKLLRSGRAN